MDSRTGNPGKPYQDTRHNVGFMALDQLAEKWNIAFKESKFKGWLGEGQIAGQKVLLLKPATYMNLSGESLRALMDFYKLATSDLIVVYDDMDTQLGQIRLRRQGGAGGHNGIKSIIQHLGTQEFDRIRIGISKPEPGFGFADYVLASFAKKEREPLNAALKQTEEAVEFAVEHPFDKTMAAFNKREG